MTVFTARPTSRRIVVLDAPSNLGLMPPSPGREPGVRVLPDAVRNYDLISRIGASDAGRVVSPPYDPVIDSRSGVRNSDSIASYAYLLARRVNGPAVLSNLEKMRPLIREADVAVLGYRDDIAGYGPLSNDKTRPNMLWLPLSEVRTKGARRAASTVLSQFSLSPVEGFWIHLDADVLDDKVMPAVDSRQSGGMTYSEPGDVLSELIQASSAIGMEITILDPDLDQNGSVIERFVTFIVSVFDVKVSKIKRR